MNSSDVIVRQTFTKEMSTLDAIHRTLETFAHAHCLEGVSRIRLELVVEELFTNMIKYSRGSGGTVKLDLEKALDKIRIELTESDVDEFNPFQALTSPDHKPPASDSIGGRGLFLVREIAEEVSYQYNGRTGTTVVVIKAGDTNV